MGRAVGGRQLLIGGIVTGMTMKLLIIHFRRVGGRYRMARAGFELSRDNTEKNNGRRKF
jgi:hypothetical protein